MSSRQVSGAMLGGDVKLVPQTGFYQHDATGVENARTLTTDSEAMISLLMNSLLQHSKETPLMNQSAENQDFPLPEKITETLNQQKVGDLTGQDLRELASRLEEMKAIHRDSLRVLDAK